MTLKETAMALFNFRREAAPAADRPPLESLPAKAIPSR